MARTEHVGTRTSPTVKRLVELLAEEEGVSVSAWADRALHREALRQLGRREGKAPSRERGETA